MEQVYKIHGLPRVIVSDRDPTCTSIFWRELFKLSKVQLHFSSAYHPQTNGQTERVNRCVEAYLRCMTGEKPTTWSSWLPLSQWWYNTNFHTLLNTSPYEVVFGQAPPLHIPYISGDSAIEAVDRSLSAREEALKRIKENLAKAQNIMKQYADLNRSEREFDVGMWVFLKLHPFRQFTLLQKNSNKLSPKYCGPFQIIERIGKVAYRLKLPETTRVHDVFHVSLLKRRWQQDNSVEVFDGLSGCLLRDDPAAVYPERILERKCVKKGHSAVTMWLVQWKGKSVDDASWESAEEIETRFPEFNPNS